MIEVKKISEKELIVGTNRTVLIHERIIYIEASGEQSTELAFVQYEEMLKLAKLVKGKYHYLIDLNKAGKNSPEARQLWKKATEDERNDKTALFGMHPVAKVLAAFVIGISRNKKMRFFNSKDAALNWLLNK